jgi:hypothetical protein
MSAYNKTASGQKILRALIITTRMATETLRMMIETRRPAKKILRAAFETRQAAGIFRERRLNHDARRQKPAKY